MVCRINSGAFHIKLKLSTYPLKIFSGLIQISIRTMQLRCIKLRSLI